MARKSLATTAIILFLAVPAYAQVSISTDDGLGVSADIGGISVDANVSTNNGIGVDADAAVGSGVNATADVGVGGPSDISADVDASIGGPSGVAASVDATTAGPSGIDAGVDASVGGPSGVAASADVGAGGEPGIDADVTASIGGDGSNGGIEGDVVGTIGDLLGLNVDLGIGGAPAATTPPTPGTPDVPGTGVPPVAEVPDDADNGRRGLGGFFSGPGNDARNDRVAGLVADMSPAQAAQYRRQCLSILADPGGFDRDLVSMCRMLSR